MSLFRFPDLSLVRTVVRIAYFDCLSGISGDMTLAALIDAGVPAEQIQAGIRSLGLGELNLVVQTVKKCGFRATHIQVQHPPEHAHRHLHHIEAMIDAAGEIDQDAKQLAKQIFVQLGEAEARVHGTTIQKVHFHEVGAVDSIADIVGAAIGLRYLEIDACEASPVPTGTGFIEIAHGRVSIPAPATAELLRGVPLAASDVTSELTTPTGAAILKTVCRQFGPLPAMTVESIGYGAGTRDLEGQANVLRLLVGSSQESALGFPVEVDQVIVVEANIDNTAGEDLANCIRLLWESGAVDVFQTPCQMKKGRSGVLVSVLCAASHLPAIEATLFTHSGTIGVRHQRMSRHKLIRRPHSVETSLGIMRGKCVWLPAGEWRFAVEFDDAALVAAAHGKTMLEVRRLAEQAFLADEPLPPPPAAKERS
ncbi:nickel pincer cofactor biosynthesis protein LarC [Planctomycetaceae bacterium SH139]